MLYDWRTVAKNISLPLEMLGWERGRRAQRVTEMVSSSSSRGFENHHPWQLSGGMQQRVSIARALSFSPALLLMDEPFGALDEMTRERLNMELLRIWAETAVDVVFVTHSISEAVFLSTRVVVMSPRPGRISDMIDIDLPQPRTAETREEPRFFELVTEVRELLHMIGADEVEEMLSEEARPMTAASPSLVRLREWLPAIARLRASASSPGSGSCPTSSTSSASCCRRFWDVMSTFWNERDTLWSAGWFTFKEALGGFLHRAAASRSSSRSCSPAGVRSATR